MRGLVELFINIEYVFADRSNKNLLQLYEEDNSDRIRLANKIKDFLVRNPNHNFFGGEEDTREYWEAFIIKLKNEIDRLSINSNIGTLPNLKDRAIYVDRVRKTNIEWWFIQLYWLFSLDVHATTRGLEMHLVKKMESYILN